MNGFFRIYASTKYRVVASLAAIAFGFLAATSGKQAEAQETASGNAPVEEIVVTAFRSSLQDAMNNKRNADGIYDSISASDIGQFPDTNLAEAIQRVPGVTIDRAQGEGRNVTVRGINPSLNKYTLNGLTLTSGNDGQEVSFDVFPSEIVSAIEVIKSPTADLIEGGIGGIVNLVTVDPLSVEGRRLNTELKGTYSDLADEFDPTASVAYVDQFLDSTFGVSAAIVFSERNSRQDSFNSNGYRNRDIEGDGPPADGSPEPLSLFNPRSRFELQERTRLTGNLGLQYQPTERANYYLKVNYTEFDVDDDSALLATNIGFQNFGPQIILDVDENNTVTRGIFGTRILNNTQQRFIENENTVIDLGADWDFGEDWNVAVSYGNSDASESYGDNSFRLFFANFGTAYLDLTTSNEVPTLEYIDTTDPATAARFGLTPADLSNAGGTQFVPPNDPSDVTDPSQFTFFQVSRDPRETSDEENAFRVDFTKDADGGLFYRLKFGVRWNERTFTRGPQNEQVFNMSSQSGMNPAALQFTADSNPAFNRPFPAGNLLDVAQNSIFPRTWVIPDTQAAIGVIASNLASGEFDLNAAPVANPLEEFDISEETFAAYVRADFETGVISGDIGLRYILTDTDSAGFQVSLADSSQIIPASFSNEYNQLLPNLNLRAEITPDLIGRVSVARVVARPSPLDQAVRQDCLSAVFLRICNEGNPFLEPQFTNQGDVALDWFFNESGYVSLGLFYKDVQSIVQIDATVQPRTLAFGLFQGGDTSDLVITPDGDADPLNNPATADFTINAPVNLDGGTLQGLEFAYQQTYDFLPEPFNYLGAVFNVTYVDSDISTTLSSGARTTFVGVSEWSGNAILFYETPRWSVRAALSYRDEFLNSAVISEQGADSITDEFLQLDLYASYMVTDNLTLVAEGINVADEPIRRFNGIPSRLTDFQLTEPRFSVGLRYQFN